MHENDRAFGFFLSTLDVHYEDFFIFGADRNPNLFSYQLIRDTRIDAGKTERR